MKRIALLAAVVLFAACAPKADAPADMAAPAADSAAMTMDTTKTDSAAMAAPMADTAKKM